MIEDHKDADLKYVRDTYIELIEKAKTAIEFSFELARDSESPRAIEVFSTLIKSASDITDRLTDLHKTKETSKNLQTAQVPKEINANQFNFYGTTAQIQEMMKEIRLDEKLINIKEEDKENHV